MELVEIGWWRRWARWVATLGDRWGYVRARGSGEKSTPALLLAGRTVGARQVGYKKG